MRLQVSARDGVGCSRRGEGEVASLLSELFTHGFPTFAQVLSTHHPRTTARVGDACHIRTHGVCVLACTQMCSSEAGL